MSDQELARDLGFLEAYTIGVGTMIGAGIFVLPGIVAASAGPASIVSFGISGFVSLLTALSLSELATGMPKAGGSYYFVNRALGSLFGSVVGWSMWAGLMFATAFYMLGFGQYLTYFFGNLPVALSALVMAALLVGVNYRGVKETGSLQNVIVVLLIGCILVFVSAGVFHVRWEVLRPFNPNGWGAVASAAATVYVTFIGFEVIATSAEEIKNPGRNLPLSMIASVLTPMLFYVLVMVVATGILPIPVLAASTIPVADVAREYLGVFGAVMMVVGAILATVSSANASILSAARVNFAMGRDRILSRWLNEVHPSFRTPYRAILVTGSVILVLIALGVGLETLADVASFSYLLTYALVHVAVIVMRRAAPEDYAPAFRIPRLLYPAVPIVGAVSCLLVVAQMRPLVLAIGLGVVGIGFVWYLVYARKRPVQASLVGEAIRPSAARRTAEGYRVVVPVANPTTEGQLLRIAAATAHGRADAELVAVNVIEVPLQTALSQGLEFEEERVRRQQELLEGARDVARKLGIGLRTRAVLGRSAGEVIQDVIEEERAAQVVLGWRGRRRRHEYILGSNLDPILRDASSEVTLVRLGRPEMRRVVVLVGEGPNAPLAVARARQLVALTPGASLTLLNVQRRESSDRPDPEAYGRALVARVATATGLEPGTYREAVLVAEDVRTTLLEVVRDYDVVCVGGTRTTALTQALFGSIPQALADEAPGSVVIVFGPQYRPRTVTDALIERLSERRSRRR